MDQFYEYDKTSSVDALKLIREVKKYELLYNRELHGYSDLNRKEMLWEQIHEALFPKYNELDDITRATIRKTVRKRWKSLRDCVVKELKTKADNPSYQRKKQNILVEQLQYIVPFVKKHVPAANCADDEYDSNNCSNSIDLTMDDDQTSTDIYYPSIRLTTDEDFQNDTQLNNCSAIDMNQMANQFETMEETQQSIHEISESPSPKPPQLETNRYQNSTEKPNIIKKRKKISDREFQTKIFEILLKNDISENEHKDEDRMFLLSLLSDFKQVLPHKKLKVKADILAAISNGCHF